MEQKCLARRPIGVAFAERSLFRLLLVVHSSWRREIIAAFHAMILRKSQTDLDPWIERARASLT